VGERVVRSSFARGSSRNNALSLGAEVTMRSSAPRWYRREFDHRLRTLNDRQLRRWLADPSYDPVMQIRPSPRRQLELVVMRVQ